MKKQKQKQKKQEKKRQKQAFHIDDPILTRKAQDGSTIKVTFRDLANYMREEEISGRGFVFPSTRLKSYLAGRLNAEDGKLFELKISSYFPQSRDPKETCRLLLKERGEMNG